MDGMRMSSLEDFDCQRLEIILAPIEGRLHQHTERNNAVPPLSQLLLTLRFLASGSFYISVADFIGLHKSTAGKIIKRVIDALAELRGNYVRLPRTPEERNATAVQFSRLARFPPVLGAVDCTRKFF